MTSWLFFGLLTPLCWSINNILDGTIRRSFIKNDLAVTWFAMLSRAVVAGCFLLTSFKVVLPTEPSDLLLIIIAGVLWTLPIFLYMRALAFEEPSRIALLAQLTPLWALVLATFILGELLTLHQSISFLLLLFGGASAALKKLENKWKLSKAFWLMLLACFAWALSDILFKKSAPAFGSFTNAFFFYIVGSALPGFLFFFYSGFRRQIRSSFSGLSQKGWWLILGTTLIGIGGSSAFAYALTLGKASLTAVLIGIQPLFALVLSVVLKKWITEIPLEELTKESLSLKALSFIFIIGGLVFLHL